ncbi:MAG: BMP family ABC transporter substrate-binding protein [Oscillospiraceae bacterium]|nr:BMP family ABC transporter substrate-binding protein [Oscillospiraceae bacterium]
MDFIEAKEAYAAALRRGQKEYKDMLAAGKPPHPAVLDDILGDKVANSTQLIGLVEIPAERIVGTRSAGRITTFSPSFFPLAKPSSEFALKWMNLCQAHLGEVGIRDPITCYEYLGNFYVEEGNKRVSVLRHFDANRVSAMVTRILPERSEDPRIKAYYEFLDFYKASGLYTVQFRRPGDYAKLLALLGKEPGEVWSADECRTFSAYFYYFMDAFQSLNGAVKDIMPEEALLMWLKVYPYKDLGRMTGAQLRKSLEGLWFDVVSSTQQAEVVETGPVAESKSGILGWIMSSAPEHVNVAFVHQLDPLTSAWVLGHEDGRIHLEETFGERVSCRSYYDANTDELAELLLEQAIDEGAQIIFTTAPKLHRITLKFAVKYPKLHFFNCSVDLPYSSVRAYYGRIFEAKFITGAIAGAMAQDDRIGYVGSNPIVGVPASINAFALGALMTNPRAQIELRWSCCEGTPQADFFRDGIRVISNRDVPTQNKMYMEFCNYGTYQIDDQGGLIPLASPVWVWGKFYEIVVESALAGTLRDDKANLRAVNYWLGMDSGMIDISLSDRLPIGVRMLAELLRESMRQRTLDPFRRKLTTQDGTIVSDGSRRLSPDELLRMDWLCHNVIGTIPSFDEVLPMSQSIVRELGIYKDKLPVIKEINV